MYGSPGALAAGARSAYRPPPPRLEIPEGTAGAAKGPERVLAVLEEVGLSVEDAKGIVRAPSLAFYNERFVVPTTKREAADISPYTERGLAGFDQMNPWSPMKRRKSYHKAYHERSKDYE